MAETYKKLKSKIETLVEELQGLEENFLLENIDIEVVLKNKKNDKIVKFNYKNSNSKINTSQNKTDDLSDVKEDKTVEQSVKSAASDSTLSTSIFKTDITDETEKTEDMPNFSETSTLNTDDVLKLSSNKATEGLRGGFNNLNSITSDFRVSNKYNKFSETSLSATSDFQVGGRKNLASITSNSETSDFSIGAKKHNFSDTSISETSDLQTMQKGGFYSETSTISNKNQIPMSKMNLIKQKIAELNQMSDVNTSVFKKSGKKQSGGGSNIFKQVVGINSSSTTSLCE